MNCQDADKSSKVISSLFFTGVANASQIPQKRRKTRKTLAKADIQQKRLVVEHRLFLHHHIFPRQQRVMKYAVKMCIRKKQKSSVLMTLSVKVFVPHGTFFKEYMNCLVLRGFTLMNTHKYTNRSLAFPRSQ